MKRSPTLALLIELERRRRDSEAGVAARARREADTAGSTLQMLQGYRLDYDTRSPKQGSEVFHSAKVRVHEAFTGRLDLAIDQQAQLAQQLADLRTQRESALAERQRRLKAFETLQARREASAQQRAQRNDQRQTDEFAAQAYLRLQRKGRNP